MSYTLLYNSVFLKSERGITPVILSGDNNVYDTDGHGRTLRRSRDWHCFDNKLAVSEEELMKRVEELKDSEEIWQRNGRVVTGKGVITWMRNGIKNAASLEDVLKNNRLTSVSCAVSVWGRDRYEGRHCSCNVSTTEAFDSWVDEAKAYVSTLDADHNAFFIVKFPREKVRSLTKSSVQEGKVLIKSKTLYLKEVKPDGLNWTDDIHDALEMDIEEAKKLLNERYYWSEVKIMSAKGKSNPWNWIVELRNKDGRVMYVARVVAGTVYTTPDINRAKKYATKHNSDRAIGTIREVLAANGVTARVVQL